jgi:hypothetical protein
MNYYLGRLLEMRLSGAKPLSVVAWPDVKLCEVRRDFVYQGKALQARKFRRATTAEVPVTHAPSGYRSRQIYEPGVDQPADRVELSPEEAKRYQSEGLVSVLGPRGDRYRCGPRGGREVVGWRPWDSPRRNFQDEVRTDGQPILTLFDEVMIRVQILGLSWSGVQVFSGLIVPAGTELYLPYGLVRTCKFITEIEPLSSATYRVFLDELSPLAQQPEPASV